MEISVVIPTHNQQERLRLVLCGLQQQTLAARRFEVVVVDDGGTDGTWEMLRELALDNLRVLNLRPNQGRNQARNRGAQLARGELVVFLDGDALPAPDLLERYLDAYQRHGPWAILCGFQRSLPDLEYFQDPQTGSLIDGPMPSVLRDYLDAHRAELVITEAMIREDFSAIHARAREGGYPFPESKKRQDQLWELFEVQPDAEVGWLGFIPHNGAVPWALLQAVDGFDVQIPFSEGWELAYRLRQWCGVEILPVEAVSYHLYHFHPFKEPQAAREEARKRYRAIEHMVLKHRDTRIRLLYFWFAQLWPDAFIPEEAVVENLVKLDRLYREMSEATWLEYQCILQHHPENFLSPLPYEEGSYETCISP